MKLATVIQPERVFRLRSGKKDWVLAELSRRAALLLGRAPADISEAVLTREKLGSTGVGAGIALPHARLSGLAAPAGFFARLDRPADWQAIDGRTVDLVFLLLSPVQEDAAHLAALAAITRRLRESSVAAALRSAKAPEELRAALIGLARDDA